MDISIVILNTNDRVYLEGCLESLKGCAPSRQVEIIVPDNASTDGSVEMLESKFPEVKLLHNGGNLGFTKGNNAGIRASSGKYVFLLNTDIKVLGDCIEKMADFLDRHPEVGLAAPKILNADMTLQCTCRKNPTLWNNFCQAFGLAKAFRNIPFFSGEEMFYFKGDRVLDVDVFVGCFSCVRRSAMDKVGLLDENFYMYRDDVDWCMRFNRAGWRVVFNPDAQAIHYGGTSTTRKDIVRYSLLQQRSILDYWRGQRGWFPWFAMWCFTLWHQAARIGFAILKYVLAPGTRAESKSRIRVSKACLLDLLITPPKPRAADLAPGAARAAASIKPTVN